MNQEIVKDIKTKQKEFEADMLTAAIVFALFVVSLYILFHHMFPVLKETGLSNLKGVVIVFVYLSFDFWILHVIGNKINSKLNSFFTGTTYVSKFIETAPELKKDAKVFYANGFEFDELFVAKTFKNYKNEKVLLQSQDGSLEQMGLDDFIRNYKW